MRISELSRRSGVPVPSIKFYIREGLLPVGEHTAKNQARYSEAHLELLDLIRTLKDDLGMSLATVANVLRAVRERDSKLIDKGLNAVAQSARRAATANAAGTAHSALDRSGEQYRRALSMVRDVIAQMGWKVPEDNVRFDDAVAAVATVLRVWPFPLPPNVFSLYAHAAAMLAEHEIPEDWDSESDQLRAFKYALLGTYLFEPVLLTLRRLAHTDRSTRVSASKASAPIISVSSNASRSRKKTARRRSGPRGV